MLSDKEIYNIFRDKIFNESIFVAVDTDYEVLLNIVKELNLHYMSEKEFTHFILNFDKIKNPVAVYNYLLKDKDTKNLFSKILFEYQNDKNYLSSLLNLEIAYENYERFIRIYNGRENIINDFLSVNIYGTVDFDIDIFKAQNDNDCDITNNFVNIEIFLLTLFGLDFYKKHHNLVYGDGSGSDYNLRRMIRNTIKLFTYEKGNKVNRFDKEAFVEYIEQELKPRVVKVLKHMYRRKYDNDDKIKVLYKLNHKKVRDLIDKLDDENDIDELINNDEDLKIILNWDF